MGNLGYQAQPSESGDHSEMHRVEKLLRAAYSYCASKAQLSNTSLTRDLPAASLAGPPLPISWDSEAELMTALDKCTADDVNLSHSIERCKLDAPVAFIHLHENKWFTLGIFVIFKGGRIPLHDHPNMSGFLKVIEGKVRIRSYTTADQSGVCATVEEESHALLDSSHPPCVLGPEDKNIHEIEYAGGSENESETYQGRPYASFIDFLSPPYKSDPDPFSESCNYYARAQVESRCVLRKCPPPRSYWTEDLPYCGQSVEDIIEELRRNYPDSH